MSRSMKTSITIVARTRNVIIGTICVKFTAIDAFELGFATFVISDAARGVNLNEGDVEKTLDELKALGVTILTSDAFFQREVGRGAGQ